jgi:hypothetical protein
MLASITTPCSGEGTVIGPPPAAPLCVALYPSAGGGETCCFGKPSLARRLWLP